MPPKKKLAGKQSIAGGLGMYPNQDTLVEKAQGFYLYNLL